MRLITWLYHICSTSSTFNKQFNQSIFSCFCWAPKHWLKSFDVLSLVTYLRNFFVSMLTCISFFTNFDNLVLFLSSYCLSNRPIVNQSLGCAEISTKQSKQLATVNNLHSSAKMTAPKIICVALSTFRLLKWWFTNQHTHKWTQFKGTKVAVVNMPTWSELKSTMIWRWWRRPCLQSDRRAMTLYYHSFRYRNKCLPLGAWGPLVNQLCQVVFSVLSDIKNDLLFILRSKIVYLYYCPKLKICRICYHFKLK